MPELRPFQIDLYQRLRARRAEGKRIIVCQAATGSGKTHVGAYLVRQCALQGRQALWMVHRRRLVDQISQRLKEWEVGHGILMRGCEAPRSNGIVVASRDTLVSRCVDNRWIDLPPAELVLVDEAHHAAEPQCEYRKLLLQYPRATIVLITATPCGPDGQGLGPWAQAIECAAQPSQLVRDGYLCPVRVFAPERKRRGQTYVKGIAGDLVRSWLAFAEQRPTVLFLSRVQHSLDAVAAFQAAGIPAVHVDANTPDDERDAAFGAVAAGRVSVLCNVGIIGEGVDLPELGCCQFFCNVGSRVRWLQGVGRVMRPSPGKSYGIVIDHAGAVFQYGFPDEDIEWTLDGNANEAWDKKKKEGKTEKAFYCKHCQIAFMGQDSCPRCGKAPVKPPPSLFAPPPCVARGEILTEAERAAHDHAHSREVKEKTWMACLAVAAKRGKSFKMAAAIYHGKYGAWPEDGFPCKPGRGEDWSRRVADVYPGFARRRKVS